MFLDSIYMWKAFQECDKNPKTLKTMKNHWFPMKTVVFVEVTMWKPHYSVWKRYKPDLKYS